MLSSSLLTAFHPFTCSEKSLSQLLQVLRDHEQDWAHLREELVVPLFRPVARKILPIKLNSMSELVHCLETQFSDPIKACDIVVTFLQSCTEVINHQILGTLYALSLDPRILRLTQESVPYQNYSGPVLSSYRLDQHLFTRYCYFQHAYRMIFTKPAKASFFLGVFRYKHIRLEVDLLHDLLLKEEAIQDLIFSSRRNQARIWSWLQNGGGDEFNPDNGHTLQRLVNQLFSHQQCDWKLPESCFKLLATWQARTGFSMPSPPILQIGSRRTLHVLAAKLDRILCLNQP